MTTKKTLPLTIRNMQAPDLANGLLDTLANLAEVNLTPAEAALIYQQRLREGVRTLVALVDGRVIGTLTLLVEHKFIHRGGKVAHIEDVAVHPKYEGRGVGRALTAHALEQAKRLGCYKVILNCHHHVREFYERLGFRPHDTGMRLDLALASGSQTADSAAALNGHSISVR